MRPVDSPTAGEVHEAAPHLIGNKLSEAFANAGAQSWLLSLLVHMSLLVLLALTLGTIKVAQSIGEAPRFEPAEELVEVQEVNRINLTEPPSYEPPPDIGSLEDASQTIADFQAVETPRGDPFGKGSDALDRAIPTDRILATASIIRAPAGGISSVAGPVAKVGDDMLGKNSDCFSIRNKGPRNPIGGTIPSERSVAAALSWIARHQSADGSWSLDHTSCCKSGYCSGPGEVKSPAAGTGLALLTFLAAGQTHQSKGPYQRNITAGVNYLLKHQARTGDLATTGEQQMYTHGLCTIALCEAYGMTSDSRVGLAAQAAIDFIVSGQNNEGGWRYTHGSQDSDTSVFGWQVMALKSGQMAKLRVEPRAIDGCKRYLKLCSSGKYRSEFGYTPGSGSTFTMTSVGLLTTQYLGANRGDPVVTGGIDYLANRPPILAERNSYYWYYATQAMHNAPGPEWDAWNRKMRRVLIDTQDKTGCMAGSWDPQKPTDDPWGKSGGRLMVTALSTLTLEVYYRYLPLYKTEKAIDLNAVP